MIHTTRSTQQVRLHAAASPPSYVVARQNLKCSGARPCCGLLLSCAAPGPSARHSLGSLALVHV
eukprot:4971523-Prymnesium_polylepis.2